MHSCEAKSLGQRPVWNDKLLRATRVEIQELGGRSLGDQEVLAVQVVHLPKYNVKNTYYYFGIKKNKIFLKY